MGANDPMNTARFGDFLGGQTTVRTLSLGPAVSTCGAPEPRCLMRSLAFAFLFLPCTAAASGFDWGSDCSSGDGSFDQYIPWYQTADVGDVPIGKRAVFVELNADDDVDVQLIDVASNTEIIAWPNGLLNGAGEDCVTHNRVTYCYSGYNGDQTADGKGREWIEIRGDTNVVLAMRAFGYAAGDAQVSYSWNAVPTCGEVGDGEFSAYIAKNQVTAIGNIPAGKTNVAIDLDSRQGRDVDVQLYDGNEALVMWPSGQLNGSGPQELDYRGMRITYSGYNGLNGDWGRERIEIWGRVPAALTMKAYGYQSGHADVTYEWGVGAGATCGGIATLQCQEGLLCKAWQIGVADAAGSCHTESWCGSDETAATDCSNLMHIMVPGQWTCEEFECHYQTGPPVQ